MFTCFERYFEESTGNVCVCVKGFSCINLLLPSYKIINNLASINALAACFIVISSDYLTVQRSFTLMKKTRENKERARREGGKGTVQDGIWI